MPKSCRWSWLIAVLLVAGCATLVPPGTSTSPLPPPSPIVTPAPGEMAIQFQRTGGIAGRDETWMIYGDGHVEYVGNGTGQNGQLPLDRVASLIAAAQAADFLHLQDSYVPSDTCCDRYFYAVTIVLDGHRKTVRTIDAAPDQPPALTALLSAITATLN